MARLTCPDARRDGLVGFAKVLWNPPGEISFCTSAGREDSMKFIARSDGSTIDAFQWTAGGNQAEEPGWILAKLRSGQVRIVDSQTALLKMEIDNGGVVRIAEIDDWIVRDRDGNVFPFRPAVFGKHYRRA